MDKNDFEQKELMEAKKIELKRKNEEIQGISREISYSPKISVAKFRLITANCRC